MNFGAYKRYCEFGGEEQREEPRVREFREFGIASLRGISVLSNFEIPYGERLAKNVQKRYIQVSPRSTDRVLKKISYF